MKDKGSISLRKDVKKPYWYINWPYKGKNVVISRCFGLIMYQDNLNIQNDTGYKTAQWYLSLMRNDNNFKIYTYKSGLPPDSIRHGLSNTRTYITWQAMIMRCTDKNHKNFKYYGGRGISICERWLLFKYFYYDMGNRPEGKTLDRINVNGNYEPGNCRWATSKEQAQNRRKRNLREKNVRDL